MAQPACCLTFARRTLSGYPGRYQPPMSLTAAGRLAGPPVAFRSTRVCAMAHGVVGTHRRIDRTLLHGRWRVGTKWASGDVVSPCVVMGLRVTSHVSLHLIFSVIVDDLPISSLNCDTTQTHGCLLPSLWSDPHRAPPLFAVSNSTRDPAVEGAVKRPAVKSHNREYSGYFAGDRAYPISKESFSDPKD
jgi:hypothetical protein